MKKCKYCRGEYSAWTGDWQSIVACEPCVTARKAANDAMLAANAAENAAEAARIRALPAAVRCLPIMGRQASSSWEDRQNRGWDKED
jgi:hypothetical protein